MGSPAGNPVEREAAAILGLDGLIPVEPRYAAVVDGGADADTFNAPPVTGVAESRPSPVETAAAALGTALVSSRAVCAVDVDTALAPLPPKLRCRLAAFGLVPGPSLSSSDDVDNASDDAGTGSVATDDKQGIGGTAARVLG